MSKIKLTKGELKRQRDALSQFRRYLPTLQLKKQQLQMKVREVVQALERKQGAFKALESQLLSWVGLLGESKVDMSGWCVPEEILTSSVNIAGVNVPVFEDVRFVEAEYDYYEIPLWVDRMLAEIRKYIAIMVEMEVLREQARRLEHELRVTTQRVNLFEKVKIPECLENIRVIRIYLGDQMTSAVGIGKVAKKKLELAAC